MSDKLSLSVEVLDLDKAVGQLRNFKQEFNELRTSFEDAPSMTGALNEGLERASSIVDMLQEKISKARLTNRTDDQGFVQDVQSGLKELGAMSSLFGQDGAFGASFAKSIVDGFSQTIRQQLSAETGELSSMLKAQASRLAGLTAKTAAGEFVKSKPFEEFFMSKGHGGITRSDVYQKYVEALIPNVLPAFNTAEYQRARYGHILRNNNTTAQPADLLPASFRESYRNKGYTSMAMPSGARILSAYNRTQLRDLIRNNDEAARAAYGVKGMTKLEDNGELSLIREITPQMLDDFRRNLFMSFVKRASGRDSQRVDIFKGLEDMTSKEARQLVSRMTSSSAGRLLSIMNDIDGIGSDKDWSDAGSLGRGFEKLGRSTKHMLEQYEIAKYTVGDLFNNTGKSSRVMLSESQNTRMLGLEGHHNDFTDKVIFVSADGYDRNDPKQQAFVEELLSGKAVPIGPSGKKYIAQNMHGTGTHAGVRMVEQQAYEAVMKREQEWAQKHGFVTADGKGANFWNDFVDSTYDFKTIEGLRKHFDATGKGWSNSWDTHGNFADRNFAVVDLSKIDDAKVQQKLADGIGWFMDGILPEKDFQGRMGVAGKGTFHQISGYKTVGEWAKAAGLTDAKGRFILPGVGGNIDLTDYHGFVDASTIKNMQAYSNFHTPEEISKGFTAMLQHYGMSSMSTYDDAETRAKGIGTQAMAFMNLSPKMRQQQIDEFDRRIGLLSSEAGIREYLFADPDNYLGKQIRSGKLTVNSSAVQSWVQNEIESLTERMSSGEWIDFGTNPSVINQTINKSPLASILGLETINGLSRPDLLNRIRQQYQEKTGQALTISDEDLEGVFALNKGQLVDFARPDAQKVAVQRSPSLFGNFVVGKNYANLARDIYKVFGQTPSGLFASEADLATLGSADLDGDKAKTIYGDLAEAFAEVVAIQEKAIQDFEGSTEPIIKKVDMPAKAAKNVDSPLHRRLFFQTSQDVTNEMGAADASARRAAMFDIYAPENKDLLAAAIQSTPTYDQATAGLKHATSTEVTPQMKKALYAGAQWSKLPSRFSRLFNVTGRDNMDVPSPEDIYTATVNGHEIPINMKELRDLGFDKINFRSIFNTTDVGTMRAVSQVASKGVNMERTYALLQALEHMGYGGAGETTQALMKNLRTMKAYDIANPMAPMSAEKLDDMQAMIRASKREIEEEAYQKAQGGMIKMEDGSEVSFNSYVQKKMNEYGITAAQGFIERGINQPNISSVFRTEDPTKLLPELFLGQKGGLNFTFAGKDAVLQREAVEKKLQENQAELQRIEIETKQHEEQMNQIKSTLPQEDQARYSPDMTKEEAVEASKRIFAVGGDLAKAEAEAAQVARVYDEVNQLAAGNGIDMQAYRDVTAQRQRILDENAQLGKAYTYIQAQEHANALRSSVDSVKQQFLSGLLKKENELEGKSQAETYYGSRAANVGFVYRQLEDFIKNGEEFDQLPPAMKQEFKELVGGRKDLMQQMNQDFADTTELKAKRLYENLDKTNRKRANKVSALDVQFEEYDNQLQAVEDYRNELVKHLQDREKYPFSPAERKLYEERLAETDTYLAGAREETGKMKEADITNLLDKIKGTVIKDPFQQLKQGANEAKEVVSQLTERLEKVYKDQGMSDEEVAKRMEPYSALTQQIDENTKFQQQHLKLQDRARVAQVLSTYMVDVDKYDIDKEKSFLDFRSVQAWINQKKQKTGFITEDEAKIVNTTFEDYKRKYDEQNLDVSRYLEGVEAVRDKARKNVDNARKIADRIRKSDLTQEQKEERLKPLERFNDDYVRREEAAYNERIRQRQKQTELRGEQEIMQAQRAEMQIQQMNRNWQSRTAIDPLSRTYFQRQNMYDQYRSQYNYNDMMVKRMEEQQLAAKNAIDNAATDEDRNLAQAQYDSATASLDHYRAALESTKEAMKEFGDTAGNFKTVGNMLAAGLETAATAADKLLQNFGRKMIRQAFTEAKNFVVQFDSQMRSIQAITMKTDEQMQAIKKATIDRAIELKTSVANVASVESDLYRQGLNDQQVEERTSAIIKFSTVTGAKVTEAGKAITTAIQNGLVSSAEEAMDALTALGDSAATTANEIFKGMQKSAAAAKVAGVSYEELTSMLTIGISKTQMSGQVIGTAMQTIFSRMNRVTNKGYVNDETGASVSINDVEKALSGAGIQLRKEGGKEFRNSFDVLRDLSKVWGSLSDIQRSNVTYTMAGGRQTNVFQTLMEGMAENNGAELDRLLGLAENSEGTTESKYAIAVKSITAAMEELKATYDGLVANLSSDSFIVGTVDGITSVVNGLKNLTSAAPAVGAAITVITSAIALFTVKALMAKAALGGATGFVTTLLSIAAVGGAIGLMSSVGDAINDDTDNSIINGQNKIKQANKYYDSHNERLKPVQDQINKVRELGEAYDKIDYKSGSTETQEFQKALDNLNNTMSNLTGNISNGKTAIEDWKNTLSDSQSIVNDMRISYAKTADMFALKGFKESNSISELQNEEKYLTTPTKLFNSWIEAGHDEEFMEKYLNGWHVDEPEINTAVRILDLQEAYGSRMSKGLIKEIDNMYKEDVPIKNVLQHALMAVVNGVDVYDEATQLAFEDFKATKAFADWEATLSEEDRMYSSTSDLPNIFNGLSKEANNKLLKSFSDYVYSPQMKDSKEYHAKAVNSSRRDRISKLLDAFSRDDLITDGDELLTTRLIDKLLEDTKDVAAIDFDNKVSEKIDEYLKQDKNTFAKGLKKEEDYGFYYDDGSGKKIYFDNVEDAKKEYMKNRPLTTEEVEKIRNINGQIEDIEFMKNIGNVSDLEKERRDLLDEINYAKYEYDTHSKALKDMKANGDTIPETALKYNRELEERYISLSNEFNKQSSVINKAKRIQKEYEKNYSVDYNLDEIEKGLKTERDEITEAGIIGFDEKNIYDKNGQKVYPGLSEFINSQTSLTKKDYSDAYKAFSSYLGQVEDYDSLVNKITDVAKQLPDFAGVYQNDEELQKMLKSFENKDGRYTISQLYDYIQKQARGATLRDFAMSSVSSANAYDQELAAYNAIQNGKATNEQYDIIAKQFGLNRVNFQANQDKYMSLEGVRLNSLKASSEQTVTNYLQDTLNATLASMSSKEIEQAIKNGSDLFDIVSGKYASGLTQENRTEYENAVNTLRSIGYTTTIDSNKQFKTTYNGNGFIEDNPFAANGNKFYTPGQLRSVASNIVNFDLNADEAKKKYGEYLNEIKSAYPELYEWMNTTDATRKKELETEIKIKFKSEGMEEVLKAGTLIKDLVELADQFSRDGIQKHEAQTTFNTELETMRNQAIAGQFANQLASGTTAWANIPARYRELIKAGSSTYAGMSDEDFFGNEAAAAREFVSYLNSNDYRQALVNTYGSAIHAGLMTQAQAEQLGLTNGKGFQDNWFNSVAYTQDNAAFDYGRAGTATTQQEAAALVKQATSALSNEKFNTVLTEDQMNVISRVYGQEVADAITTLNSSTLGNERDNASDILKTADLRLLESQGTVSQGTTENAIKLLTANRNNDNATRVALATEYENRVNDIYDRIAAYNLIKGYVGNDQELSAIDESLFNLIGLDKTSFLARPQVNRRNYMANASMQLGGLYNTLINDVNNIMPFVDDTSFSTLDNAIADKFGLLHRTAGSMQGGFRSNGYADVFSRIKYKNQNLTEQNAALQDEANQFALASQLFGSIGGFTTQQEFANYLNGLTPAQQKLWQDQSSGGILSTIATMQKYIGDKDNTEYKKAVAEYNNMVNNRGLDDLVALNAITSEQAGWIRGLNGIGNEPADAQFNIEQWMNTIRQMSNLIDMDYANADAQGIIEQARNFARFTPEVDENNFDDLAVAVEDELERQAGYLPSFISRLQKASPELAANMMEQFGLDYDENGNLIDTDESGLLLRGLSFNWKDLYSSSGVYSNASNRNMIADILSNGFTLSQAGEKYGKQLGQSSELLRYLQLLDRRDNGEVVDKRELDQLKEKAEQSFSGNLFTGYKPQMTSLQRIDEINKLMSSDNFEKAFGELDESIQSQLQSFPGLFDYMATYGKDSEQAAKAAKTLADAIRNEVIGALEEEGKVLSGLSGQMNTIINGNIVDSVKGMNNLNQQITDLAEVQTAYQRLTSGQGLQRQEDWDIMQSMFGISAADISKYQLDTNKLKADYGGIMGEVENLRTETLGTAVDNILVDLVGDNAYKEDEPQTFIDRIGRLLGFIKPKRTQKTTEEIIKDMSDEEIAAANARLAASGLGQIKDRKLVYGGNANEQLTWSQQLNEALQRRALFGQGDQSADFKLMLSALTGAGNIESFLNIVNGYQQYGRFTTTAAKDFLSNADFLSAVEEAKSTGNIDTIMQMLLNGAYGITASNATRMTTSGVSEYITAALSGDKIKLEELKKNNPTMLDYLTNNVQGFNEVYSAVMSGQQLEQYQIDALKAGSAYQAVYEQERNGKLKAGSAELAQRLANIDRTKGPTREERRLISAEGSELQRASQAAQIAQTMYDNQANLTETDWEYLQTKAQLTDEEIKEYKKTPEKLKDLAKDLKGDQQKIRDSLEAAIVGAFPELSSLSDLAKDGNQKIRELVEQLLDMSGLQLTEKDGQITGISEITDNRTAYEILTQGAAANVEPEKEAETYKNRLARLAMQSSDQESLIAAINSDAELLDYLKKNEGARMLGGGFDEIFYNSEHGWTYDQMRNALVQGTGYAPLYRDQLFNNNMEIARQQFGEGFGTSSSLNLNIEQLATVQSYIASHEDFAQWLSDIEGGADLLYAIGNATEDFTYDMTALNGEFSARKIEQYNKFNKASKDIASGVRALSGDIKDSNAYMKSFRQGVNAIANNQYYREKYKKGDRSNDVLSAIAQGTGLNKKDLRKGGSAVQQAIKDWETEDKKAIDNYLNTAGTMLTEGLQGTFNEKLQNLGLDGSQIQLLVDKGQVTVDLSQLANEATGAAQAQIQEIMATLSQMGMQATGVVTSDGSNIKLQFQTTDLGKGRRGGGGGGGGGGKSAAQKLLERLKREQALLNHEIKMIQYQETKYENASEIGNQNRMIELENDAQKRLIATLEKHIETTKKQMAKTKKNSDDWKSLYDSVLAYEEAIEEANIAIQENTKKIEENEQAILKLHTDLEAEVDTEINNRIQRERDMLAGTVSMQDAIIEAIRARYRAEWALIEKDIEKKRAALEEEKNLIDERLQRRKDAEDEAEKYEELSEYKKQLALIEMDSTRTKDAAKLREQIAKIEKEIGWDVAEDEADYQKEQIDSQLQAYDDFVTYGGEDLEAWLEDANNLADEVNQVMKMSQEGMLDWLKANVEEYGLAMDAAQKQMIQGWIDTYEQMIGYTHTYWEEIADILSGKDLFLNYMMASQDYINASEDEQKQMLYDWGEMYDNWIAAQKRDAVYNHDDDGLSGLGTNGSKKKKSSGTKPKPDLETFSDVLKDVSQWVDKKLQANKNLQGGYTQGTSVPKLYATGGLVNYTGPAWVDGTPTKPEAFLSADDTALIRSFLDEAKIVRYRSTISNVDSNAFGSNAQNIGELVINITEAQFKDDADFDEVAHRVGEKFVKELSKQGFNTMSYSF